MVLNRKAVLRGYLSTMISDWKKAAVTGGSFGAAAAFVLIAAAGVFYWYNSRPKEWDNKSIKCLSASATQTFTLDEQQKKLTANGFDLKFVLLNTTNRDYTVPQDIKLFQRDEKSSALEEFSGTLSRSFTIPAKERVQITVSLESSCGNLDLDTGVETERDAQTCFKDALGGVSGFVGFDYLTRTELNLLKPTLSETAPANDRDQSRLKDAPDRGDVFDRAASCQRADRLVDSCRKQKIETVNPAYSHYGGYQTPLPTLPVPPKKFELEATPSVCKVAFEWQNYCRTHK